MSWFDKSFGLAKNALLDVQKQIDKALDIQDSAESVEEDTMPIAVTVTKDKEYLFYGNSESSEMITTPPKGNITVTTAQAMSNSTTSIQAKRQSVTSNSDSIELISPPTTPCSGFTSPSEPVNSPSVELLTAPTSSNMISPDSIRSLPESIVIIANDEGLEDDDDSMSFSTVMCDTIGKHLTIQDSKSLIDPVIKRCSAPQALTKLDDALIDSQTINSDSTQSFENIQIADAVISIASDEKDLVKINSGPSSSDHNSNDEIETTTSSDIEIISNPNGDSNSSTNSVSRSSPRSLSKVKEIHVIESMKKLGHFREPSEVSIQSEDSQSDTEKLLHRISELSEILEARELRLLEFGRQNAALQDKNLELQLSLDSMKQNTEHLDSEEYTQRLSALEKKFQMSIRERDKLRLQLKEAKEELESQIVAENNIMISGLRSEGEKLAKEILQQSNIIKKLRAKEKTSDSILKKNKEQIADLTEEVERLKKTLNVKEEVELVQIDKIHKMSSEKRKLEEECTQLRSKFEDMCSNVNALRISLDTAKSELENHNQINSNLTKVNEEINQLIKIKEKAETDNKEMVRQINELREKLRISENGITMREQKCREDNASLLKRLEESESRFENITQEISLTTIPLTRQIESLQATLMQRTTIWESREKELMEELNQSQIRLKALQSFETDSREKIDMLEKRCKELEKKLSEALMREETNKIAFHQLESDYTVKETDFIRQISNLNEMNDTLKKELENVNKMYNSLESKFDKERVSTDTVNQCHDEICEISHEHIDETQRPGNISPTSLGKNSIEDGNIDWQVDDLDCISSSGRQGASVYGMHLSFPSFGHDATTLEHLQSILKQRDGEVSQLQWELSRLQVERRVLNSEIMNLTLELENIKEKLQSYEVLEVNFSELQRQYDALLQMYGEKVEKAEELELDLQDVKDMYKAQINDLLHQQNKLTS